MKGVERGGGPLHARNPLTQLTVCQVTVGGEMGWRRMVGMGGARPCGVHYGPCAATHARR